MINLGITRQLDNLGRIVLPAELRKKLDLNEGSSLDFYLDGSDIVLRKNLPSCAFCESAIEVQEFKGKFVCSDCVDHLTHLCT